MFSLDDLCNTRSGALGPALRFCPLFIRAIIFLWFHCMNSFPQINHFPRPGSCERLSSLSGTICHLFFCHVHIWQPLQFKKNMYWLKTTWCVIRRGLSYVKVVIPSNQCFHFKLVALFFWNISGFYIFTSDERVGVSWVWLLLSQVLLQVTTDNILHYLKFKFGYLFVSSIKSGCVKCHRKQLRQQLEPAVC